MAIGDIDLLVGAGEARPLLPEFDVGPVWWRGGWWVVPQGANTYRLAGPDWQQRLSDIDRQLAGSAQAVAEIAAERSRQDTLGRDGDPDLDRPWRPRGV